MLPEEEADEEVLTVPGGDPERVGVIDCADAEAVEDGDSEIDSDADGSVLLLERDVDVVREADALGEGAADLVAD